MTSDAPLHTRIIAYIEKYQPVTYDALEARAKERGYNLFDFEEAIQRVHKDKRIRVSNTLVYTFETPKLPSPNPHLDWLRENYPRMTSDNDGSGVEADFSYLFLTPEQVLAYKAKAKGMPLHMIQSKKWQVEKTKSRQLSSHTLGSKVSSVGATTMARSTTRSLDTTARTLGLRA